MSAYPRRPPKPTKPIQDRPLENMLLKSIAPKNILSFGDSQPPIELTPLTLLIGPNGSGKSNLLECVSLLQSAPCGLSAPAMDWLWQGGKDQPAARLEAVIANPNGPKDLRYWMEFTASGDRFALTDERVENEHPDPGHDKPYFYFAHQNGWPVVNVKNGRRQLKREEVNPAASILSQRRNPDAYPEITWLGDTLGKIRLYRNRPCGRPAPPQKADMPADFLSENLENLGPVLNKLRHLPEARQKIRGYLRMFSPATEDFDIDILGGTEQVLLMEGGFAMPASRLSDGTLRFLCLLAILCHPEPPPLVCIEEPESGLHPDVMPALADLLRDASTRTQLLVTTHSDLLAEAFIKTPANVIALEKSAGQTVARRLDADALENWLDEYTLGPA